MSGVCLTAAALMISLPLQDFTLAWTHSIEKIRWEEDYRVTADGLHLVEARIRGSGAGMEPPDGAVLENGIWRYRPAVGVVPSLRLARSGYVPDYQLCQDGNCRPMRDFVGTETDAPEVIVSPCGPDHSSARTATHAAPSFSPLQR